VAVAFFQPGKDYDYIVMQTISPGHCRAAIHEYTHLAIHRSNLDLPLWLDEGLADLYSTMQIEAGSPVRIGAALRDNVARLRNHGLMTLEALGAVDHSSSVYNEKQQAKIFYAESWALVHMLNFSEEYRPRFKRLMTALAAHQSIGAAFAEVYGKSLEQVRQDLSIYIHGHRFSAMAIEARLAAPLENPVVSHASGVEAAEVMADVLASGPNYDQAKAEYDRLLSAYPQSLVLAERAARLALRWHDPAAAARYFARAQELGSTDARLYYNYAASRRGTSGDAEMTGLLRKAIHFDPSFTEAQLLLASFAFDARDYYEAFSVYKGVNQLRRDQAFRYYIGLAFTASQVDAWPEARLAAGRAKFFAMGASEIARADEVMAWVNSQGE
jgi:tetratricopeptide (TPR) repeat protein